MTTKTAEFLGYVSAVAEAHPLQTIISFVLTDFEPNSNKQAVPISEAENIIRTAKDMPVKINFDGMSETGHNRAVPIGVITKAELVNVDGKDSIIAEARIWKKEYPEIDEYLRSAKAEKRQIGTSWELYYEESEEKDNVSWLTNIVMAATAIVKVPAYGNRTPILSVAEDRIKVEELNTKITELESKLAEVETALADARAEADSAKDKVTQMEREQAESAKEAMIANRIALLTEAGVTVEDEHKTILAEASDDVFNLFMRAFPKPAIEQKESVAEVTKARVPATFGATKPKTEAVATALLSYFGEK